MLFKNSIRDTIRRNGEIEEKKEDRAKRNYDRFFEGYTKVLVPRKNGNGYRVKHVYVGMRYRPELDDRTYFFNRMIYIALYGLICFLLIHTAAAPVKVNCTWYVGAAQALCVFFLGWVAIALIYSLVGYGLAWRKGMSVYTYKSMTKHFKISLNGLMGSLAFLIGMNALWILLHIQEVEKKVIIGIFAYAVSFLAVKLIRYMESSLSYTGVKA